jgi:ABC-type amino acid transport substrate-binding protein
MRLLLLAVLALAAHAAQAASNAASSAADAGSSALGSVSDSFRGSSNSSSGGEHRAEGRYRVTEVAKADAAGKLRLTLEREGAAPVELTLPQQALAARAVNVGDEVQATPQAYGVAFAHADTGQAFFLVLEDAWARELAARVVKP